MMESLEKEEKDSSSKLNNLNKYMGNLKTYQKKKARRDPNNRVNIPYYRKISRMRYSERDQNQQNSIMLAQ